MIVPPQGAAGDGPEALDGPHDGCDADGVVEDITGDEDTLGSDLKAPAPEPCTADDAGDDDGGDDGE